MVYFSAQQTTINMAKRYLVPRIPSLLLLCFLIIDAAAASPSNMSKPDCDDRCGTVTLPYPYGMGRPECFLNGWYEIECRDGTHPFLKKINLQVLSIDFSYTLNDQGLDPSLLSQYHRLGAYQFPSFSYINVNFPIILSNLNCTTGTGFTSRPPSLEGSPFLFSSVQNTFVAVGCGVKATLNSSSDNTFAGCQVECRAGNFNKSSNCSGFDGCCKTPVPSNLQTLNVDIINLDGTGINDQQCNNNYATLVNASWLRNGDPSRDLESLKMEGYVPVVLDSRIRTDKDGFHTDDCALDSGFSLADYSFQCACKKGYQGNPYLFPDGCRDINECEDLDPCLLGRRCENTLGGYLCVGPSERLKFVMIGLCLFIL